jgi:hypothetical protein
MGGVSLLLRLTRIVLLSRGRANLHRKQLFHLHRGLTSGLEEGKAALSPPYSAC